MAKAIPHSYRPDVPPDFGASSGLHAQPFLSSRARRWNGIVGEVFRVRDVDYVAQFPDHVVSLFLRGPVDLLQRRNGHTTQRTMRAGDIIFTPAGEPKLLRHREEAEIIKLRIAPSFLEGVIEDVDGTPHGSIELLDNFGTRDAHLEALARRVLSEIRAADFASRIYVESLANQLVVHLLRHYSTAKRVDNTPSRRLPRYKLDRAIEFIDDHLRENLTLDEISQSLSMSPYHFAHAFKQTVGLAPHRYITQHRIELAKSLLRETELSITQIAHHVGYSSQSHFSVVFHQCTGQTPREYRRDT
jgi:AraC family transcriptional regulator